MAMNQSKISSDTLGAAVVDANVLIAICAREQDKLHKALAALGNYAAKGWRLYAPNVLLAETLYILCGKLQNGSLTQAEHNSAIQLLQQYLLQIAPPPSGDFSLAIRAEASRQGYGCSRSADGLYIALAEELAQQVPTELVTFDQGIVKQAARNAPAVKVHLLFS